MSAIEVESLIILQIRNECRNRVNGRSSPRPRFRVGRNMSLSLDPHSPDTSPHFL